MFEVVSSRQRSDSPREGECKISGSSGRTWSFSNQILV